MVKRCPFCGGEAEIVIFGIAGYKTVGCKNCGVQMSLHDTIEETIEAWNTRDIWHTGIPQDEGLYLCNVILSEDDDNVPYYILIYKNNEFRTKITDFVIPKEHIIKWQKIEER